ncbi:uncharacterized protein Tco025E_00073 [Trypanosoma conorhini]|uniref:Uncharacterized protein n=1 Tax=Trypanosoma conorhini TaxID=83891 RepID=A0A422QCM0_9TRYP|nr:uncharacterized protein Tco025E_00073 [Trypanosoma conorhini]RNF27689.1 hypothetical protein Tco025E_00073 [Trypanosoma conorhini]
MTAAGQKEQTNCFVGALWCGSDYRRHLRDFCSIFVVVVVVIIVYSQRGLSLQLRLTCLTCRFSCLSLSLCVCVCVFTSRSLSFCAWPQLRGACLERRSRRWTLATPSRRFWASGGRGPARASSDRAPTKTPRREAWRKQRRPPRRLWPTPPPPPPLQMRPSSVTRR